MFIDISPHPASKILFDLAHEPHKFILGSHAWPQNMSFRVAQHTNPVRYCPLWASQSTHSQGFHPSRPWGFKRILLVKVNMLI